MPNSVLLLVNFFLLPTLYFYWTLFIFINVPQYFTPQILSTCYFLFLEFSPFFSYQPKYYFLRGIFVMPTILNPSHNLLHSTLSFFFMALSTMYIFVFRFCCSPLINHKLYEGRNQIFFSPSCT